MKERIRSGEQTKIKIARYIGRCGVLGPGTRGVLWVQGCPFNCAGCISPEGFILMRDTLEKEIERR